MNVFCFQAARIYNQLISVPLAHKTHHRGLVGFMTRNCNNGDLMYKIVIIIYF